jgi:cell fate regulator YaaT (PSP1 superfamily)
MGDYRDDHSAQSEEDLRHLEDEQPREREGDRTRGRAQDARELPGPIYRIRATHSNETFYAYFDGPIPAPAAPAAPAEPAEPAAAMDEPRTEIGDAVPAAEEAPAPEAQAGEEAVPAGGEAVEAAESAEAAEPAEPAESAEAVPGAIRSRTMVVVPTRYGRDLCELQGPVLDLGSIGRDEVVKIERVATEDDLRKAEANKERERKAFDACRQKIASRNLPMKLVSAHYLLEEPKVLFYFSAESRVDFRELVKDLVAVFKMRIELRQIGVRDEARVTGGCGVCGRVLCCHGVTDKLVPVSIKMAKDQNLSLNSMKISGPCGRLLCCLAYEYGFYRDSRRELPSEGARFPYDGTLFRVIEVNPLSGTVKAAGEDGRLLDMSAARFEYAEGRWRVREEQ